MPTNLDACTNAPNEYSKRTWNQVEYRILKTRERELIERQVVRPQDYGMVITDDVCEGEGEWVRRRWTCQ